MCMWMRRVAHCVTHVTHMNKSCCKFLEEHHVFSQMQILHTFNSLMNSWICPWTFSILRKTQGDRPDHPMLHAHIFKGEPRRFALGKLVNNWYKLFPFDHNGQAEINDSTILSNKNTTVLRCTAKLHSCTERWIKILTHVAAHTHTHTIKILGEMWLTGTRN